MINPLLLRLKKFKAPALWEQPRIVSTVFFVNLINLKVLSNKANNFVILTL